MILLTSSGFNNYLTVWASNVTDTHALFLQAREFLEYGESKKGYWTSNKFMKHMEMAVIIAEFKYPCWMWLMYIMKH